MSEQEQPVYGGSYTRQPDGSLVRHAPLPDGAEPSPPADAPAAKTAKKGK